MGLRFLFVFWIVIFGPLFAAKADGVPAVVPPRQVFFKYAVAAGDTNAAEAASQILGKKGNAADAAVAAALTLGVSSPASSGLGGGGFGLYYRAKDKSLTFIDFREVAPRASKPDMFAPTGKGSGPSSLAGGLAVAVPGEPAGLAEILQRFGKIGRATVAKPAIDLALKGYHPTAFLVKNTQKYVGELSNDAVAKNWFVNGENFSESSVVKNPTLAKTLQTFASQGAQPFYKGAIAQTIIKEVKARHGVIDAQDLQQYKTVERKPLEGEYVGYRWVTAPPPSAGGYTLLASLALIEKWYRFTGKEPASEFAHALSESWKGPAIDRMRYWGDPAFATVPIEALLSPERLRRRETLYHYWNAAPTEAYDLPLSPDEPPLMMGAAGGGTSHVCVVDEEGNVASFSLSVNMPWGARFTAAGMVMNDQMDDFARAPGASNGFGVIGGVHNLPRPGARPVSTMTPLIVFDAVGPVLCAGGSGGSRIVTAVEQAALYALKYRNTAYGSVSKARFHHQGFPEKLEAEPVEVLTLDKLKERGHTVVSMGWPARVQLIRIARHPRGDVVQTELHAASDPRNGAEARGE